MGQFSPVSDFSTDFSTLDPSWELYNSGGHAGTGLRRPSALSIQRDSNGTGGSVLKITAKMGTGPKTGQIVSGGLAFPAASRTYGRYTYRLRVDKDPSNVTSGVAILWPRSNRWPEHGEVNMFETWNHRDTRKPIEFNVHWLNPTATKPYGSNDDRTHQVTMPIDGSQWHTYCYEWTAERLSVSVDGSPQMTILDDPAKIPHWDMKPTFQLDPFAPTGDLGATPELSEPVSLYVDFLRVEPLD